MRADYSELCYFWGTNSYPYIDLNYINNNEKYSNENINTQEINQFIKSTSDAFTKMTEVSPTLNIDVKTKIKVLSKAADYALNPYISKSLSDFIKQNNIFIFNIPYLLQKQSNLEKYKKKAEI